MPDAVPPSPIVVAFTGASGAPYGVRLLTRLLEAGRDVHLTISPAAVQVFQQELNVDVSLKEFHPHQLRDWDGKELDLSDDAVRRLTYHHFHDYSAGIASGSFLTSGMVICPCSMGTLGSLAAGLSSNLIHRAADVHLKERRKLILVPRETPLGPIPLGNMKTLADAGAVILPAMPGFYHRPQGINDLIDFVVNRICDQLGVHQNAVPRWGNPPNSG